LSQFNLAPETFSIPFQLTVFLAVILFTGLSPLSIARADTEQGAESQFSWKWLLEENAKYTCTATSANASHTDTHRGSVSFEMPDVGGKVDGKDGKYFYSVTGQTLGNPYQYSTPGTLTFKGEVFPGLLRFTPQVYLPDGRPFYQPVKTFEMPIYDGATHTMAPESNAEMDCSGSVIYTLRGPPREHYHILVDDRFLLVKDHGVFSGHTYRTGLTLQTLTEMEVIIEDGKVKKTSGTRQIGRQTPLGHPPLVWDVSIITGKCWDGSSYPFVPTLTDNQVSAVVQGESSVKLSAQGGYARGAARWTINPKQAKLASPDIQYGRPERFNGDLCTDAFLSDTAWTFPRRRNSYKITQDTFDHLQILTVTQETTAMGESPGASSGQTPRASYFKGDTMP